VDWLNVTEASRVAGVSPDTIRRWCDAGKLPSIRTSGGHRRVSLVAVQSLLRDGSALQLGLSRETRDVGEVMENWHDQVDSFRPFDPRAFDDAPSMEKALYALVGAGTSALNQPGGLIGALLGLAREYQDALDLESTPPPWLVERAVAYDARNEERHAQS